jgi:hypothetical protein
VVKTMNPDDVTKHDKGEDGWPSGGCQGRTV